MNFEMVGKLSIGKETEKFHPYEEKVFDSGWKKRRLVLNAVCGDNRHMLTIDDGCWADGHGEVVTFSKPAVGENGTKEKGRVLRIPFKERLTSPLLEEVADYRKYVIDLDKKSRRTALTNAAKKIHEGTSLTDEELTKLGLNDESEVEDALKKSKALRHEFITEYDFAEFMKKLVDGGAYKDAKFHIYGNVVKQYSDNNARWYERLAPNGIYMLDDGEEEEKSIIKFVAIFNKDAIDDMSVDEKGRYYINAYTMEYDFARGKNIPSPVQIAVLAPDKSSVNYDREKQIAERIVSKFTIEDESWKAYGVEAAMINGAQRVEITEDMLTEDQIIDLGLGLITMEDIRAEFGQDVYGDRVQEYRFIKALRGYSKGVQDTAYTDDDMVIQPLELNVDSDDDTELDAELNDDNDDDLFG